MRGLTGLRAVHIRFYFSKIRFTYVAHVRSGGYQPIRIRHTRDVAIPYYYLVWQMWRPRAMKLQCSQQPNYSSAWGGLYGIVS